MPDLKEPTKPPAHKAGVTFIRPGIVTLETVQKMVADFEQKDSRKLTHLPGRILVSDKEALIKSSQSERFYRLIHTGNSWQCGCKAAEHGKPCWHVRDLERCLRREAASA